MRVTVADVEASDNTWLTVRIGDVKRMRKLRKGEVFDFDDVHCDQDGPLTAFAVFEVLTRLGAPSRVNVKELLNGAADEKDRHSSSSTTVQVTKEDGSNMNVVMQAVGGVSGAQRNVAPLESSLGLKKDRAPRHQSALQAEGYMELHSIQEALHVMIKSLLMVQPENPFLFMVDHLQKLAATADPKPETETSAQPSASESTFASPCPPPKRPPPGKGKAPPPPPPGKGRGPPPKAAVSKKASGPAMSMEEALAAQKAKLKHTTPPPARVPSNKTVEDPAALAKERSAILAGLELLARQTPLGLVVAAHVSVDAAEQSKLGQGRFASVVLGTVSPAPESPGAASVQVAAKRFASGQARRSDDDDQPVVDVPMTALRSALREAHALVKVSPHPNIVELLGIVVPASIADAAQAGMSLPMLQPNQPPLQLLLRPCSACLAGLLSNASDWNMLGDGGRLSLLTDCARGLVAIHLAEMAHMDVKSHNILVDYCSDGRKVGRICDLGSMRRAGPDNDARGGDDILSLVSAVEDGGCGTSGWTAPELLEEATPDLTEGADLRASDVFSFGVLVWAMLCGPGAENPLVGLVGEDLVQAIRSGVRPRFAGQSQELVAVASECWSLYPAKRPSLSAVLQQLEAKTADGRDTVPPPSGAPR